MKKSNLPLRFSILKLLDENAGGMTPHELFEALKGIYMNEKQCQPRTIDGHLMSMKGVGMVRVERTDFDSDNQLIPAYSLTEYGKSKVVQYIY